MHTMSYSLFTVLSPSFHRPFTAVLLRLQIRESMIIYQTCQQYVVPFEVRAIVPAVSVFQLPFHCHCLSTAFPLPSHCLSTASPLFFHCRSLISSLLRLHVLASAVSVHLRSLLAMPVCCFALFCMT